jgi:ABC-type transporter Mla subunit MlaD
MRRDNALFVGALAGSLMFVILAVSVWLAGATFGQRCEAYFPDASVLQVDHCVRTLSQGDLPEFDKP